MGQQEQQQSFGNKIFSTAYKFEGWNWRLKSISSLIIGIFFILAGIVLTIISKSFNALILSLIGLIVLLGSWFLWKRSKSLVKGRYY